MDCNYITIGHDCSPAAALRNLNVREFALPFDWVVSTLGAIDQCFATNFEFFHKELTLNHRRTRLIDHYGFQFPHDYPLNDMNDVSNNIGEGVFGEENGKFIKDNWTDYHDIVLEKYNRRINRFKNIINDTKPIIVLCRYNTKEVLQLQQLFVKYYNRTNLYFVNSSNEVFENNKIKNIYTEKNNQWNDADIWNEGINDIRRKIDADYFVL